MAVIILKWFSIVFSPKNTVTIFIWHFLYLLQSLSTGNSISRIHKSCWGYVSQIPSILVILFMHNVCDFDTARMGNLIIYVRKTPHIPWFIWHFLSHSTQILNRDVISHHLSNARRSSFSWYDFKDTQPATVWDQRVCIWWGYQRVVCEKIVQFY